jgi:hypothetical protein
MLGVWTVALIMAFVAVAVDNATFNTGEAIERPLKCWFMGLMFLWVARDPIWRPRLIASYLAGWVVFAVIAYFQISTGRAEVSTHYQVDRVAVLGMNENVEAILVATGMVLLLAIALESKRPLANLLAAGGFLAACLPLSMTASRTGLATLVAGCLAVLYGSLRSKVRRGKARAFAGIIVLMFAAAAALTWFIQDVPIVARAIEPMQLRVATAVSGEDGGERLLIAWRMVELLRANPAGIGQGQSWAYLGMDPHNGYLKIAAEAGLAGMLMFVPALWLLLSRAVRLLNAGEEIGVASCFLALSVAALGGQSLVESPYWFFFALLLTGGKPREAPAANPGRQLAHA